MTTAPDDRGSIAYWWPVILLIVLNCAITTGLSLMLNVWVDEAYSLHSTGQGPTEGFRNGIGFERQAPLYFALLGAWRTLGASAFHARLLSVLLAGGTLAIAAILSRRLFPRANPAWLVAILAFNPLIVWAASEIRVYALSMFLCAGLLWSFSRLYDEGSGRPGLSFGVFAALALYSQYYLGLLLVSLGAVFMVRGRWSGALRFAMILCAVAVVTLPIATWLPGQLEDSDGGPASRFSLRSAAKFWVDSFSSLMIPGYPWVKELPDGPMQKVLKWCARLIFGLVLATVAVRHRERFTSSLRRGGVLAAWLMVVLVLGGLTLIGALLGGYLVFDPRYCSFLVVPASVVYLSIAVSTGSSRLVAGFVAVSVVLNLSWIWFAYQPLAKRGDARRVASYLEKAAEPHEPVFVFPNEQILALRWYYRGAGKLVPIPRDVSFEEYRLQGMVIADQGELAFLLDAVPEGHTAWLLNEPVRQFHGVQTGHDVLRNFLAEHFVVEGRRAFYQGILLEHIARKSSGGSASGSLTDEPRGEHPRLQRSGSVESGEIK